MRLKNNIIVKVYFDQNKELVLNGSRIITARRYSDNWREKNPSVCEVIEGNEYIPKGRLLIAQYNAFEFTCNFDIELHADYGIYAIPFDKDYIVGWVDFSGNFYPMNDNLLVHRFHKEQFLPETSEYKKPQIDRVICDQNAYGYKKGDLIFTYQYGNYEVFYVFNGEEKRYIKVNLDDIVGVVRA